MTCYCFKKSLQSVLKTWQVLKSNKEIFWKMSKYRNTVFYDFKSRFLVYFFQYLPAPCSVENTVSQPYFSQNLEIPYWKSSFPVHRQIALRHGCSPVNLLHIFRTPFPKNTSGWLLLFLNVFNADFSKGFFLPK